MSIYTKPCSEQDPVNYYGVYSYPQGCKSCIGVPESLTTNPWVRYQTQKRIQKTVGVSASEYLMNLASLSAFDHLRTWNAQSDRHVRHVQHVRSGNRTSDKPGYMSPGGTGCDIKHNSYERRLLRLKGKAPLRRQAIPPSFLSPTVPFTLADPIRGDKRVKTSIVNGNNAFDCVCDRRDDCGPIYEIRGPYEKSSNSQFNTILTFTQDSTIILFSYLAVHVTVASKDNPSVIVFENDFVQSPNVYPVDAGTANLVITLYFNDPCILKKESYQGDTSLRPLAQSSSYSSSFSFYPQYPFVVGSTVYAANPANQNKIEPATVLEYNSTTYMVTIQFVNAPMNTITVSGSEIYVGKKITCTDSTTTTTSTPSMYSTFLKTSPVTSGIIHYL